MGIKDNKLIVVLGMHRSGTSALTRGLKVIGAEFSNNLQPAMLGVNEKGFFEDNDIVSLNEKILSLLSYTWDTLTPITHAELTSAPIFELKLKATELLRAKIQSVNMLAIKDPRVARVLPFWKEVFSHCQFDVSYVLAVRHPLSVVKSLAKRDGFDAEKSYLLWLGHVIRSLTDSAGNKRVLVDFDLLMQSPDHELNRIAKELDLKVDPNELKHYKAEFLDKKLRNTVYYLKDLALDDSCPPLVREVYATLLDVASDKIQLDNLDLQQKFENWATEFERINTALILADKLNMQKIVATQTVAEREGQITGLNQTVTERDGHISNLNRAVTDRDAHIANYGALLADRDVQIEELKQDLRDRDAHIANYGALLADRDIKIEELKQSLAESRCQADSVCQSRSFRLGYFLLHPWKHSKLSKRTF